MIFVVFQVIILRRRLPNLRRIVGGFVCVLAGLTLFLVGLEEALFPIGETMANQLTAPAAGSEGGDVRWNDYLLVYAFAAAIGFATTVAEPSLIAIALKAEQVSGGAVRAQGLRIAVAVGVAVGVSLGCFRIVTGTPLPWYIVAAYAVVIVQTYRASKMIVPLAYDSGGVTTSTVTVPRGRRIGVGRRRVRSWTQSIDRRIRADRLRKRVSDHVGARLLDAGLGKGERAPQGAGRRGWQPMGVPLEKA